jgi:membrane-associated phospholipid phosphatase
MGAMDYFICLISAIVMIIGGYQFYFFVQKHHYRPALEFDTLLDDRIPFWPSWVWIYSGLYYPIILLLVFTQPSFQSFNYTAFSFLVLLAMQFAVFYFFPVRIPAHWRRYQPDGSLSLRMLAFVHRFDKYDNSIPSMHVSVATLTALHLHATLPQSLGNWLLLAFLFPLLISMSALFTKQHYVADILPGVAFGWIAYVFTSWLLS